MQKTELICNNFSGINRTSSIYSSSLITASDVQNVELYATGVNSGVGIRTAKGNVSICSSIPEGERIINIYESVQKGRTNFFVHTEDDTEGKIYLFTVNTKTLTLKVDGLSLTGISCGTDVSQGWSDLFVFSNSEELLSIELENYDEHNNLDEIHMMNLTDAEDRQIKGLGVVIFAGRLWIFNGHILWYSRQEDIYDFSTSDPAVLTSAGYIEFVKDITALYPYLGTLAVFHKNSSCLISRDDSANAFYKTMDSPGGCAGVSSLVFHGTELYFYDDTKKGIFSFREVVNGNKTLGENIAINIQSELFDIPATKLNDIKMVSVVTSDRNEVWFLLPDNDENHSTILIFDYIRKSWIKRKSQKISCVAMIGNILYSGGNNIYEEYVSSSFDGEFIDSYYKCTPLNLGRENRLKVVSYPPKITLDMNYTNNFYVEYIKNYDTQTSKLSKVKSKTLANVLYFDIGHWDYTYFPAKDINSIKKLPVSFFKTLQMTFLTKNSGDSFCIKNIEFEKIKTKAI